MHDFIPKSIFTHLPPLNINKFLIVWFFFFTSRYIRSHNRAGLNYTLDSNELADVTDEEFEAYKGLLIDPSGGDEQLKKQAIPEVRFSIPHRPLPDNLDWREYGK